MNGKKSTPNPTVLPGFPKIPADASPALRAYLSAISEALEVRLGRRGDVRDAAVTYRDLIDAGLASINTLGNNSNTGGTTLTPNDPYLPPNTGDNPSYPVAPQGFQVNGSFSRIICQWANPYDLYYGHSITEIWRHTSDVLGDAEFIGSSAGMIYVDEVGEGESYYYWARHVNSNNVPGPWNSNSGTFGQTADDVVFLLEVLADAITYDEFAQSLKDEIDLISVIENTLYGGNLANPPVGSVMYDVSQNYSAIQAAQATLGIVQNDITSLQTVTSQNATAITNLNTTVANNSSNITTLQSTSATNATDITALETTVFDPNTGTQANANALSGLNTSVTNINGTLTAHGSDITTLNNAVFHPTTGLSATSIALNGLTNTVTSNANDINANQTNITANANAISALQTTVSDPTSGNSALSTAISSLTSTVTQNGNDIAATASDVTTLSSTVNGQTASIQQNATTIASVSGDVTTLNAEYSVKLDVNGNVSGYGLASGGNPQYSRFYVNADAFAIVPAGTAPSTSTSTVPFAVVTTPVTQNGVTVPSGTYINTAMIANGSIDNARIGNLAVDTQQIADLAVQSAKIDDLAVTNAKIQDSTIQNAKIANTTITGAKIQNATIDTLQVAGEAVVVPRSAQGSGGAIYSSWTQIGSLTINWGTNSNDIPSQVVLIGSLNQLAQQSGSTGITRRMKIQADTGSQYSGIVGSAESGVSTQQGWSNDHAASCLHTGRTGSVTYRILASTTGASTNAGSWSLTVFGAKR